MEKLPMFAAGWFSTYNSDWKCNGTIYRSGDGKGKYEKAVASGKLNKWLHKVLFFTVMEYYCKIRSFTGSDARFYRNELCLDTTNGSTLASKEIEKMTLDEREQKMMELWKIILEEAK
jgi:hypothetical protein